MTIDRRNTAPVFGAPGHCARVIPGHADSTGVNPARITTEVIDAAGTNASGRTRPARLR